MHVLATLIDFVQNAQQRCRRISERPYLNSCRNILLFDKSDTAFFERMDKGRLKVGYRIAHREHQLARIHVNANRTANRNFGLCRIKRPGPLALFARHRKHLVFKDNITHIG